MSSCGTIRLVPGPRGQNGADGAPGEDGASAFTTLTASFTMPAELATAVATVADTSWMTTGMYVYMQGAGWLQVTAIADSTHVTLMNLEDTATGAYEVNVNPGTGIANGSQIVATGPQGPAGTDGSSGAPTTATYLTKTSHIGTLPNSIPMSGLATGFMFNTTATGVTSIITRGTANANVAVVDDAGGLTSGEALFATASGIESKSASAARTALGLDTMSQQAASAVAITGGTILGITTGAFTALGTQSFSATGTSSFLGTTGIAGPFVLSAGSIQSLLAGTQVNANRLIVKVVGNGGAVTLTNLPNLTDGIESGQLVLLMGTSNANTVTLQDDGTLPGSRLALGSATRTLGLGDTILLLWDLTTTTWYEVSFSNP